MTSRDFCHCVRGDFAAQIVVDIIYTDFVLIPVILFKIYLQ